ncbi:hypothetical protein [Amycolatopsis japonica]
MDLSWKTESFAADDTSWLRSRHGTEACVSGTLDTSAFTPSIHYPDGFFKSGLPLGKITATGMYGPYGGTTDEVQTLTVGGSGLTSFTITYSGQTTGSIAANASAAAVQTALEALSNIAPGDVTVTGSAGGPWTLTFGGTLADTNVAAVTTTPTGGTGTVTVATTTAGGAEGGVGGLETLVGHLMFGVKAPATNTVDVGCAVFMHGAVVNDRLPIPVDAAGKAEVAGRIWYV